MTPRGSTAAVNRLRIERRHEAVPFANRTRLSVEVEGVARLIRTQDAPRRLLKAVDRGHLASAVDLRLDAIEALQNFAPRAEPQGRESIGHREVRNLERSVIGRIGHRLKRLVRDSQVS